MKIQMNRISFYITITGLLLFITGCPAEPSQSQKDASAPAASGGQETAKQQQRGFKNSNPALCQNVTEQELRDETRRMPNTLTRQFDDGNVTMSFVNNKLTFKGYIYGNGNNFRALLNGFDKFRSNKCVRTVSFEGKDTPNFEWRPNPDSEIPPLPEGCAADVDEVFDKSPIKDQINKNFYYRYNQQTGILQFSGYIHDFTGRGKFTSTVSQLQRLMRNGCIRKIELSGEIVKNYRATMLQGFEWTLCEAGMCECAGMCVPCPCS